MKSTVASLAVVFLCSTNHVLVAGHEGNHGHQCACEAIEFDFEINCDDNATMLTAFLALQTDGCSTDCMAGDCEKNYLIVQTHHDYCPEAEIPTAIEAGFHDFDSACTSCEITRKPAEGLPDCPAPTCDDNSGNTAYAALIADGCSTDCSAACTDNFRILRTVHDNCEDDTLSQEAEEGLHALREPCAAVDCNTGKDTALVCEEEDPHDHGDDEEIHGHQCACEAIEFDFEINCDNDATMLAALSALQTGGCSTDCTAGDCEKNWLIVQSHHDYCPEAEIPTEIEAGFHDFDSACTSCEISRKPEEGLPDCPAPTCGDDSGRTAYTALIEAGCSSDCTAACADNYRILRSVHDLCDHDVLGQEAEEGIHALEVPCAAFNCNSGADVALTCDEDDEHTDAPEDTSSACSIGSLASIAAFAVAGIAM